jgi:GT2 family glycosyltransferase
MSDSLNNYHFVVATSSNQENFNKKSQISLFLDKFGFRSTHSSVVFNNKKGLPKLYNSFINETNKDKRLIFVHDDVLIEDLFLEEKLDIAFEKFDIVGLAGSKKCDLSRPPAWHLMSDKNEHVGEVAHSHNKVSWTTCFGPTDSRALLLDGLFLAVRVDRLLETDTFFDERFNFHHYDITFCLKANQNKLKLGVAPIKVTHFGLGDSMNTPEWHKSAQLYKKHYVDKK